MIFMDDITNRFVWHIPLYGVFEDSLLRPLFCVKFKIYCHLLLMSALHSVINAGIRCPSWVTDSNHNTYLQKIFCLLNGIIVNRMYFDMLSFQLISNDVLIFSLLFIIDFILLWHYVFIHFMFLVFCCHQYNRVLPFPAIIDLTATFV